MPDDTWISVATFPDRATAEATLGLLTAATIPCYIASNEYVPGLGSEFSVRVPARLRHRADWVLESVRVSVGELDYLATGKLGDEPDEA